MESNRTAYSDYEDSLSENELPTSTSENVTISQNSTRSAFRQTIYEDMFGSGEENSDNDSAESGGTADHRQSELPSQVEATSPAGSPPSAERPSTPTGRSFVVEYFSNDTPGHGRTVHSIRSGHVTPRLRIVSPPPPLTLRGRGRGWIFLGYDPNILRPARVRRRGLRNGETNLRLRAETIFSRNQ